MSIDKIYPPQSEGQHLGRMLADFLLWCWKHEMPAKEIVESAAARIGLHPSEAWRQESDIWTILRDPGGEPSPVIERRIAIFEQVVSYRESAIGLLCQLLPSRDFADCAEMAETLFNRAFGHVGAASDDE
jgi:hypothetical protein